MPPPPRRAAGLKTSGGGGGAGGTSGSEEPVWLPPWVGKKSLCCAGVVLLLQNLALLRLSYGGLGCPSVHPDEGNAPLLSERDEVHRLQRDSSRNGTEALTLEVGDEEEEWVEDDEQEEDEEQAGQAAQPTASRTSTTLPLPAIRNAREAVASSRPRSPPSTLRRDSSLAEELDWDSMRLFGQTGRKQAAVCVGLSAVGRGSGGGGEPLPGMLDRLFASTADSTVPWVAVVHLADFDQEWVNKMSANMQTAHGQAVQQGRLHAISAPARIYPDLAFCPPFCPQSISPERAHQQAKRNVDNAILMSYAAHLARFYVQLDDDVTFTPGWLPTSFRYASSHPVIMKDSNAPWRVIDFAGAGCVGKMVQAQELPRLANFMLLFYDQMPCEALLPHWMHAMTQGKVVEYYRSSPKLFARDHEAGSTQGQPDLVGAARAMVSCGTHTATSCADCPMGHGQEWCHGDCLWTGNGCVEVPRPAAAMVQGAVPIAATSRPAAPGQEAPPAAAATGALPGLPLTAFDNPMGRVVTDMQIVPSFEAHFMYSPGGEQATRLDVCDFKLSPWHRRSASNRRCWFWAKEVTPEQHVTLVFDSPTSLKTVHVELGQWMHPADVISSGTLDMAAGAPDAAPGSSAGDPAVCGAFRQLRPIHGERQVVWDAGEQPAPEPPLPLDSVRCIRIRVMQAQAQWLLIERLLVRSK